MPTRITDTCENRATIECYVMAAIVNAREVYTDQKWLTWADHWIAGRDRSFASAKTAHRMARQACDRESVEMIDCQQDGSENQEALAAELAAVFRSRPLGNHISLPYFPPRIDIERDHSADRCAALYIQTSR